MLRVKTGFNRFFPLIEKPNQPDPVKAGKKGRSKGSRTGIRSSRALQEGPWPAEMLPKAGGPTPPRLPSWDGFCPNPRGCGSSPLVPAFKPLCCVAFSHSKSPAGKIRHIFSRKMLLPVKFPAPSFPKKQG